MALQMIRPTKRPGTGVYQIRLTIPKDLQDTAMTLYGVRSEFRVNLKTKNPAEARTLAPPASSELEGKLAAVRRAASAGTGYASDRDIQALAGDVYRDLRAEYGDNPGKASTWATAAEVLADDVVQVHEDPEAPRIVRLSPSQRADTLRRLAERGLPTDPETVQRAAAAVWRATILLFETMERRASGDWSADRTAETFPTPQPRPAPTADRAPAVSFDTILAGWAADNGHGSKPGEKVKRSLYDRERTLERLATFLGHRDVARVLKADAVRWKESMQTRGNKVPTIRNDLSEMSAIWKWAIKNDKAAVNPFDGVSPPKPKRQVSTRRAFTNDEAAAILTAVRTLKGYMRWMPWVCCFTGARLSEVCQSTKADVMVKDGISVLCIHDEGEPGKVRSIKNNDSRRSVPIHPALVAEGFLAYVAALPDRSPLFPDAKPDGVFGIRGTNVGRKVSRWLKDELKITDPKISPNHSWRHWFIEACRGAGMNPEVRSALTGHSARMDESSQYGAGMGSFIKVLADALATVPSPLRTQGPALPPPEPAKSP